MPRFIALFDSITVLGTRLRMADIRHALESDGCSDIATVVASTNVLFTHDDRPTQGLTEKIAMLMLERFDMDGAVLVRSHDEMTATIAQNPFAAGQDDTNVRTLFLSDTPDADTIATLARGYAGKRGERIAVGDRAVFIDYGGDDTGGDISDSRLTPAFIARRLGCTGIIRDQRAVTRMVAKMDEEKRQ